MVLRVTQAVNEVWVKNPSRIRVTQVGNEIWNIPAPGRLRVTQAVTEVWRSVAGLPLTIEGHADGVARCYAISSQSVLGEGHADGYATARDYAKQPLGPFMMLMGI